MFPLPSGAVSMVAWTIIMMMLPGHADLKVDKQTEATVKSPLETVTLELDPSILHPSQTIQPLQNRSISPWTYNKLLDATVFPPVSEARCVLVGCLNPDGTEDARLRSKPILHQVTLLRRVESPEPGGRRRFRLEPRLVAVGCTCIRDVRRSPRS